MMKQLGEVAVAEDVNLSEIIRKAVTLWVERQPNQRTKTRRAPGVNAEVSTEANAVDKSLIRQAIAKAMPGANVKAIIAYFDPKLAQDPNFDSIAAEVISEMPGRAYDPVKGTLDSTETDAVTATVAGDAGKSGMNKFAPDIETVHAEVAEAKKQPVRTKIRRFTELTQVEKDILEYQAEKAQQASSQKLVDAFFELYGDVILLKINFVSEAQTTKSDQMVTQVIDEVKP
jgi:hypothetical protein